MAKAAEVDPFSGEIVWTEQEVQDSIEKIIPDVLEQYRENHTVVYDHDLPPVFVPMLQGAKIFADALEESLKRHSPGFEPVFTPITLSTYDAEKKERRPRVVTDADRRLIEGRHVFQTDDILDSGETARFNAKHLIEDLGAASVSTIVLVERIDPDREIQAAIAALRTDRKAWFIGWGMNDDALPGDGGRSLRDIRVSPNSPY